MNRRLAVFLIILISSLSAAWAKPLLEGTDVTINNSYDFYTAYVWRGFTLDTDPVFQPGIYVNSHNVTAALWSNWAIQDKDTLKSDEIDFSVDYTYQFSYFNLSVGNINYNFSGIRTNSSELYAGVQLETLPFMPNIVYYYDYSTRNGSYLSIDTVKSYQVDTEGNIKFSLGFHAGYNNQLLINGQGEDLAIITDLGLKLTQRLGISFVGAHSIPFSDLAKSNDGNQQSRFYAGLRIGAEF